MRLVHGTCHAVPGTDWHVPCTSGTAPLAEIVDGVLWDIAKGGS
jgi:hypothetical protein